MAVFTDEQTFRVGEKIGQKVRRQQTVRGWVYK